MPAAAPQPAARPAPARPPRTGATVRRSPWVGVLVFGLFAAWAVTMVIPAVLRSQGRAGNDAQHFASEALARAMRDVPFTVRLPATLPGGAELVRVFLDKPDYEQGFQVYTLNTYYTIPGRDGAPDRSVHVWQTNDPYLDRKPGGDPPTRGVREQIAGRSWTRVVDDRLRDHEPITAFSSRFDDDVTVAVDATQPDDARATIRALTQVTPGELTGGVDVEVFRKATAAAAPSAGK